MDNMQVKHKLMLLTTLTLLSTTVLAGTHVYDYKGTTYPSYWHKAWYGIDDTLPPTQSTPTLDTEYEFNGTGPSANNYGNLANTDSITASYCSAMMATNYASQKFRLRIEEPESSITGLDILWGGYGGYPAGFFNDSRLYIWNNGGWMLLGSHTYGSTRNITASLTTNLGNYIDNSGDIYLLAESGYGFIGTCIITDYVRVNVTSNATTVVLQPGSEGKDASIGGGIFSGINYGNSDSLEVGIDVTNRASLLQFNLSRMPSGSTINSAILYLFKYGEAAMYGAENDINVYRITSSWDESNVNFNNQPSIDSTIINTTRVFNENETWILWNITDLVGGWSSGIYPNYGLMLKGDSHAKYFYSSDKDNETVRPKLIITYSAPTYTGVSGCANITQQGMYRLTANITNSNENTCFYVNVSDVEFDCQNNIIDGVDKGLSYGFYAKGGLLSFNRRNITLRNCSLTDWTYGVYYFYVNDSLIEDVTANSSSIGILMSGGYNNSIRDCEAYNNAGDGVHISNNIKMNYRRLKAAVSTKSSKPAS